MKDKLERVKIWIKENPDFVLSLTAGGCFVALGVIAYRIDKRTLEAQREAYEDQKRQIAHAVNSGKTILPNPDGSFWIIDIPKAA